MEAAAAPRRSIAVPPAHAAVLLRAPNELLSHVAVALAECAALQEGLAALLGHVADVLRGRPALLQGLPALLLRVAVLHIQFAALRFEKAVR